MKEKGIFFTDEQKELLKEIDKLEGQKGALDERKTLTVLARMRMVQDIQSKYSMLRNKKGIFDAQLFSAMEEYLYACNDTGYRLEGLSLKKSTNENRYEKLFRIILGEESRRSDL